MYHGIVNVYKEKGFTSFDVVAKMRGIYGQKKIGHTGTLDPDAEGVLIVCLGSATKLSELLVEKTKEYTCTMLLGQETDTEDISGTITKKMEVSCTEEQVKTVIESFVGEQMQIPPMYSAIKYQGKKLYEYARAGIVIEREPRPVIFYKIDILEMKLPEVTMRITCSAGTYIRSLCRDIGATLGCGGCMKKLVRNQVSQFLVKDSLTLDELNSLKQNGRLAESVLSVTNLFPDYTKIKVKDDLADKLLHNGNAMKMHNLELQDQKFMDQERVFLFDLNDQLTALYKYNEKNKEFHPYKMLIAI